MTSKMSALLRSHCKANMGLRAFKGDFKKEDTVACKILNN